MLEALYDRNAPPDPSMRPRRGPSSPGPRTMLEGGAIGGVCVCRGSPLESEGMVQGTPSLLVFFPREQQVPWFSLRREGPRFFLHTRKVNRFFT